MKVSWEGEEPDKKRPDAWLEWVPQLVVASVFVILWCFW